MIAFLRAVRRFKRREKILALVTGVLLLVVVGHFLFSAWGGLFAIQELHTLRDSLVEEVNQKQARVRKGRELDSRLDQWQRRSLPADPQVARSTYKNWLWELSRANLRGAKVDSNEGRQLGDIYHKLTFSVRGQATIDQLTEFLYKFHSAGHLHQIRSLSIQPIEGSKNLDLKISVEALSLPGADHRDRLPEEPSERLAVSDLAEYREVIAQRDVFAPYVAPRPPAPTRPREQPREPGPPPFDPSKHAYLTAIVRVDDQPQAWLLARTTGEKFRLCEGDAFQVGPLRGTVVRIGRRDAEIEIDGQRWLLPIGDNLRQTVRLPDE